MDWMDVVTVALEEDGLFGFMVSFREGRFVGEQARAASAARVFWLVEGMGHEVRAGARRSRIGFVWTIRELRAVQLLTRLFGMALPIQDGKMAQKVVFVNTQAASIALQEF